VPGAGRSEEGRGLRLREGGPGSRGLRWWCGGVVWMVGLAVGGMFGLALALTGGLGSKRLLDGAAGAGAGFCASAAARAGV
jgi:hypothetical protein